MYVHIWNFCSLYILLLISVSYLSSSVVMCSEYVHFVTCWSMSPFIFTDGFCVFFWLSQPLSCQYLFLVHTDFCCFFVSQYSVNHLDYRDLQRRFSRTIVRYLDYSLIKQLSVTFIHMNMISTKLSVTFRCMNLMSSTSSVMSWAY